jgi:hypothetical protein
MEDRMHHRPRTLEAVTAVWAAALLAGGAAPRAAGAQGGARRWSLELYGGAAWSAPMPLRIEQEGEPRISLTARYHTRPWQDSPYYMYRAGRWDARGRRAWEVELLHHKVYLVNRPAEVQRFEITHGYNMIFVDRAGRFGQMVLRAGAGPVVAHTEAKVRGRSRRDGGGLFGGYFLSGAGAQLAASRRVRLAGPLFVALEGKVTGSWARVPIADGHATAPVVAAHALAGLGLSF